jgi:hypothetical protein
MKVDLQPIEPLSQVVFVHDYLHLVFQDRGFTLYNVVTYSAGADELHQGQPGFCDALVSLIGQIARAEAFADKLQLRFLGGAVVSVPVAGPDTCGPEAWQFSQLGGPTVVEQNA